MIDNKITTGHLISNSDKKHPHIFRQKIFLKTATLNPNFVTSVLETKQDEQNNYILFHYHH